MLVKLLKIAALCGAFLLVVGVSAYLTLTFIIKSEDTVIVPDLIGQASRAVEIELRQQGPPGVSRIDRMTQLLETERRHGKDLWFQVIRLESRPPPAGAP